MTGFANQPNANDITKLMGDDKNTITNHTIDMDIIACSQTGKLLIIS